MKRGAQKSGNRHNGIKGQASRFEGKDHISTLPISVIVLILSFLPFEDWVSMCQVKREWRHLSSEYESINFDEWRMIKGILVRTPCNRCGKTINPENHQCLRHLLQAAKVEFIHQVDSVLDRHAPITLERFTLSLQHDPTRQYAPNIDRWVQFAMTSNIKELELSFFNWGVVGNSFEEELAWKPSTLAKSYDIPFGGFAPKILQKFMLRFCKFRASNFQIFAALHKLSFVRVKLMDTSIGDLITICPVVEELYFMECVVVEKYFVYNKPMKIKKFSLINCMSKNRLMIPMDITASKLSMLIIEGTYLMGAKVREADSLVDVRIGINQTVADSARGNILGSFLNDLIHCRTLYLTSWCIQVLPTGNNMQESLITRLDKLKHLALQVGLIKEELPGIACLLNSCPELECLTLFMHISHDHLKVDWDMFANMIPNIYNFDERTFWATHGLAYQCLLGSLKRIRIIGFSGSNSEIRMVYFLLKHAQFLENLELHIIEAGRLTRDPPDYGEYQYILKVSRLIHHLANADIASPLATIEAIPMNRRRRQW